MRSISSLFCHSNPQGKGKAQHELNSNLILHSLALLLALLLDLLVLLSLVRSGGRLL